MPYNNDAYSNGNGYEDLFRLARDHEKVKAALRDAESQDLYIIDPGLVSLKIAQEQWDKYNSMTKPFRRKADWITLDHFGLTNQQIYDFVYNKLMGNITDKGFPHIDGNVGNSYQSLNGIYSEAYTRYTPVSQSIPDMISIINSIENFDMKADEAEEYMNQTGLIILVPGRYPNINSLEHAFYAYNAMIYRHQYMADWKAVELFGMPNRELYLSIRRYLDTMDKNGDIDLYIDQNSHLYLNEFSCIKKYFMKVIKEGDITNQELSDGLKRLKKSYTGSYDQFVTTAMIDDIQNAFDGINCNIPSCTMSYIDLPAYSPDELIDMGVYTLGDPDAPSGGDDVILGKPLNERWFSAYRDFYTTGVYSEEYISLNLQRIRELNILNITKPNGYKEAMYKYGWNPNTPFTSENRVIVDAIMNQRIQEIQSSYDIIDISEDSDSVPSNIYLEDTSEPVFPIFIVLSSGEQLFSRVIRGITHSVYSHAMLSLDNTLNRCYSYGLDPKVKMTGSFIIEDVPKKFKDQLIRVYAVFVSNDTFNTISQNVNWFVQNQKRTLYGWRNLISYLFRTPLEREHTLVCSQFVDKMLKLGHIDFTKKSSSLIAPGDIDKAAVRSKKIYQIYKGTGGKWNPQRIAAKIKALIDREKTYKWEFTRMPNDTPGECIISEVKDAPVKIDKHGDVIIRSMKPTDFAAEYSKSHKLLVEYDKQNNTEAMKVELAKLWAYLLRIEELLYGTRSISPSRRKELFSIRAMIIGDFKKYMEVVQRSEKNFNFSEYFEKSPYSNSSYKIHGSTIRGLLKLMKEIL